MDELINKPDASRLIFGLRDTGYNVKTATADIIDNSIAAKADQINMEIVTRQFAVYCPWFFSSFCEWVYASP